MSGSLSILRRKHGGLRRTGPSCILVVAALLVALFAAACGGDDTDDTPARTPTPGTVEPTPDASLVTPAPPEDPPTEVRFAYINLMSPVSVDANDRTADETFEQRLDIVIGQLGSLGVDIVGVSEATWTAGHGSALQRLQKELKMEFAYVPANPWFKDKSTEQNEALAKQFGFEEGDAILSKYKILRFDRHWLNPRTSETEGRAALHAVIGIEPFGEFDVYVTHLTGGADRTRELQAEDMVRYIERTRGGGPVVVMGDLNEPPDAGAAAAFIDAGFIDVAASGEELPGYPTCCRERILDEQPLLTVRTDYIFTIGMQPPQLEVFGYLPAQRADGSLLYASDHNGLYAVFPLEAPESTTTIPMPQ